ncbi:MAG TPA: hypothetical protein PK014_05675 [Thermoanaerobaculia bacterium]|nr:hypothetical protein [Thermoanaerobaculia bacterium]HUM29585.1 hypothetical protein [Thermoanaerobaculia bacterium]HXK67236.1 hypothetical protein [Thermoanaerobaculia bacterium]
MTSNDPRDDESVNPYLDLEEDRQDQRSLVETVEEERVVVVDQSGIEQILGVQYQYIVIDPMTGQRRLVKTKRLLRSGDGRLIHQPDSEVLYDCARCSRRTLTASSVRFCSECQSVVCLDCAKSIQDPDETLHLCGTCFQKTRGKRILSKLRRFIEWVTTIER